MSTLAAPAVSPDLAVSSTNPAFPSWTFVIPLDVANRGFQIAIYGQDPATQAWMYWNQSASGYTGFGSAVGQDTTPLIDLTPDKGSYTGEVWSTVNLSATQSLQSGVVAMFIGGSSGIPVSATGPASPTTSTNPNDLYSLFEFTYTTAGSLDIDISNVDQVGFTYTVDSSSAPFPLALVGSTVPQATVFSRFAATFPAGTPFHECLVYGRQTIAGSVQQLRLLAPQDVLQSIVPPNAPGHVAPAGTPATSEPFANNTYFYLASETSPSGETAPNSQGVFGGFLLNASGKPQAKQINIGWQSNNIPVAYTPVNPGATGINLYRASQPPANAGTTPPAAPPAADYGLLTQQGIAEWNAQQGYVYVDASTSVGSQAPKASSYGFSALSTWFDGPLQQFFGHFDAKNPFALFQFNQNGGTNGTLWTGNVVDVMPNQGTAITSLTYIDQTGASQPVSANWTWGDGTQTYKVLQLVGNAYDATNDSDTNLAGASSLTKGEYQGAVVNLYFPYFTGNTGLSSIPFAGGSYTLPPAPSWLSNASNGPSQMVFACAGTFATPQDPDAVAQQGSYPVLATNALTNLQNVIVSALNRGVATGYAFAVAPQGYTCLYGFSQAPQSTPGGTLAAGTYTYYLSGTLNDGSESALSWPQTITLAETGAVTLAWFPQPAALYKQANVYRQMGTGPIQLVQAVANTARLPAIGYTDTNAPLPTQPANGAPFLLYPSWNDASAAGFVNSNLFSAFLHQNLSADPANGISINGLVYGYPFDDQGNFSTNINYGTALPQSITFAITGLS